AGPQTGVEDLRRRHAPRSAAFHAQNSADQLGTQLGRARRPGPVSVSPGSLLLPADPVSIVPQPQGGPAGSTGSQNAPSTGRRDAGDPLPTPEKPGFSCRRRFHLWRTECAEAPAGQLRPDQPPALGRPLVCAAAGAEAGDQWPAAQTRSASADSPSD